MSESFKLIRTHSSLSLQRKGPSVRVGAKENLQIGIEQTRKTTFNFPSRSINLKNGKKFEINESNGLVQSNNYTDIRSMQSSHAQTAQIKFLLLSNYFPVNNSLQTKERKQRLTLENYLSRKSVLENGSCAIKESYLSNLKSQFESLEKSRKKKAEKLSLASNNIIEFNKRIFELKTENENLENKILNFQAKKAIMKNLKIKNNKLESKNEHIRIFLDSRDLKAEYFEMKLANEQFQKDKMETKLFDTCKLIKQYSNNPEIKRLLAEINSLEKM